MTTAGSLPGSTCPTPLGRQEILASARELAPSKVPWVDWTYGQSSHLRMDRKVIESQRGVQQGDPLGPLLFSLALHRAFARVRLRAPAAGPPTGILDISVFFLVDGIIAGSADAVAWARSWNQLASP